MRWSPFFLLLLTVVALPAAAQSERFVTVTDGRFELGGRPYYFSGTNLWYGMNLGADDPARLRYELDLLDSLGLTNLRVMAGTEGPNTEPYRVRPAVQTAPGVYDERLLRGLDVLLAEMGARGMKAVLCLNNFFFWSGGMAQYVSWAEGTPVPYPITDQGSATWDDYQQYAARFYANETAMRYFDDYITMLATRTNTVTGVPYRDDPTIMAWQLANEPRGFANSEAYVRWVNRAAGLLQSLDGNHLVSLGGEGKLNPALEATQFERVSSSPHIDYLTAHIWIQNWGWYNPADPSTFGVAVGRAMGYLADHVTVAKAFGKPLVLEEFGLTRDAGVFDAYAPTQYRDAFYTMMLEALLKLAREGNAVGGANVWGWSGAPVPQHMGQPWSEGEPLSGDPPHEQQGWYAIFAHDTATLDVLRRYAAQFDALGHPVTAP